MKLGWTMVAVVVLMGVTAGHADAQVALGVRAGASVDPDQFYVGVHGETRDLVEQLRFQPNLEIGLGNDLTLVALNFEFVYRIPIEQTPWNAYAGGGPALNMYRTEIETEGEGGFNLLVGIAHQGGLFAELKVGMLRSPDVKFGVGYTFRR